MIDSEKLLSHRHTSRTITKWNCSLWPQSSTRSTDQSVGSHLPPGVSETPIPSPERPRLFNWKEFQRSLKSRLSSAADHTGFLVHWWYPFNFRKKMHLLFLPLTSPFSSMSGGTHTEAEFRKNTNTGDRNRGFPQLCTSQYTMCYGLN